MGKYRHLFFDWDNTLWDLSKNVRIALAEVYDKYHLDDRFDAFAQFYELYCRRNEELWELYPKGLITRTEMNRERFAFPLSKVGVCDDDFALRLNDDFLHICASQTNLCHGVKDTLMCLSEKYRLYVITNGYSQIQRMKIANSGLLPYLTNVFISDVVGYYKPDRRIFEYAVKTSNARKVESVMIGDNFESDMVGAKNFGMDQIYLSAKEEELPFEPTKIIFSIKDLLLFL